MGTQHVHNTHTTATMKRITQSHLTSLRLASSSSQIYRSVTLQCRAQNIHTTTPQPATVQPLTASGPPPKVPIPSAEHVDSRVARRRKQAELLKRGLDLKAIAGGTGGGSAKTKRFWREVHVKSVDEGLQIHLDTRPRNSHSPRMGPPDLRPPSPAAAPHPPHIPRLPRPRHRRRRLLILRSARTYPYESCEYADAVSRY